MNVKVEIRGTVYGGPNEYGSSPCGQRVFLFEGDVNLLGDTLRDWCLEGDYYGIRRGNDWIRYKKEYRFFSGNDIKIVVVVDKKRERKGSLHYMFVGLTHEHTAAFQAVVMNLVGDADLFSPYLYNPKFITPSKGRLRENIFFRV